MPDGRRLDLALGSAGVTVPFFDVTTHIFPRAAILVFLLVLPRSADRWSMDALVARRARHGGAEG